MDRINGALAGLVIAALSVPGTGSAAVEKAGIWRKVQNMPGCMVWDPAPRPDITVTWTGVCKDGKTTGLGALHMRQQNDPSYGRYRAYMGYMKAGRYHGDGAFLLGRGTKYDGNWKDGRKHGFGTYRWADGTRYEGEWLNDIQHGHGILEEPDKYRYEGDWQNGMPHGQGIDEVPGRGHYAGGWKNGRRHGRGVLTLPGEGTCDAEWRDGQTVPGTGKGEACMN